MPFTWHDYGAMRQQREIASKPKTFLLRGTEDLCLR